MALIKTPEDLGHAIRSRRRDIGWDQATLARQIGVTRQWVIDIEKGKPRAELELALRALNVLGLTLIADAKVDREAQRNTKSPTNWQPRLDINEIVERSKPTAHDLARTNFRPNLTDLLKQANPKTAADLLKSQSRSSFGDLLKQAQPKTVADLLKGQSRSSFDDLLKQAQPKTLADLLKSQSRSSFDDLLKQAQAKTATEHLKSHSRSNFDGLRKQAPAKTPANLLTSNTLAPQKPKATKHGKSAPKKKTP